MNGTFFYVVGPSGAGKDSLLAYARQRLDGRAAVLFAHRYITRAVDAGGENHVALSPAEFRQRREMGFFALDWESHGLHYGIGREIDLWLARDAVVVVNGSRAHLAEAARRYPDMKVVTIAVSPAILRQRLKGRGRETDEQIEQRLARAAQFVVHHPLLVTLRNDGPLEDAGDKLLGLLTTRRTAASVPPPVFAAL